MAIERFAMDGKTSWLLSRVQDGREKAFLANIMSDDTRLPLFQLAASRDTTLSRHQGDRASNEAHARLVASKLKRCYAILQMYRKAGATGLTAKEVAQRLGKQLHQISGRVTELRQWGFIVKLQTRRLESAVLVHRRFSVHAFQ